MAKTLALMTVPKATPTKLTKTQLEEIKRIKARL